MHAGLVGGLSSRVKVGILVGGVAILGMMWMRRPGPAPASGIAPGMVISTEETIAVDGEQIRIPPIAQSAELVAEWRSRPIPHVPRNLFRSDLLTPAEESAPAPIPVSTEPRGMFWMQLERALAARVDRARSRDRMVAELLSDAGALQIESLLAGGTPRVIISGQFVGLGELVTPGGTRRPGQAGQAGQAGRAPQPGQRPLRVEHVDAEGVVLSRDGLWVRIWRDGSRPSLLAALPEASVSDRPVRAISEDR